MLLEATATSDIEAIRGSLSVEKWSVLLGFKPVVGSERVLELL